MYNQLSRHILLYDCSIEEVLDYYDDGLDFEVFKAEILIGKLAEALAGKKGKKKTDREDLDDIIEKYGNAEQKRKLAERRKKEEEE